MWRLFLLDANSSRLQTGARSHDEAFELWRQHFLCARYKDLKQLYQKHLPANYQYPPAPAESPLPPCHSSSKAIVFVKRRDVAILIGHYLEARGFKQGVVVGLPHRHEWELPNAKRKRECVCAFVDKIAK